MLVAKDHKKLLLNLKQPERVTSIIPGAKLLEIRGQQIVSVPHTLDVARVLRNLGLAAPGPILHYYDWPGFEPFAHQKETAEAMTLNPRFFCLNDMGCIAGDELVRVSRKGKSFETTLRDLHYKFHTLPDQDTWKCRSLKGGQFGMNGLVDVMAKGVKPTLRVTLEDGKTFRCTADHRLAQPGGKWIEAGQLTVGDSLVTNGTAAVTCPRCGAPKHLKAKYVYARQRNAPCAQCKHSDQSARMSGPKNPSWKGGRVMDCDGYVRLWLPHHHRADGNGYVYEHIVVAESAFGEEITQSHHVHHKNGVKHDNTPGNLEVMLAADHHREHDPRVHLDGAVSAKGGRVVVLPREARVASIEPGGEVDVYDLSMEAPHHNFVVNGVVVHNSGKTVSALWAYDFLRGLGELDWCLVVSPLSTLERAWGDEIFRNFQHLSFAVLHGPHKLKLVDDPRDIYIINHDGLKNSLMLDKLVNKPGNGLIIVDELASFRNSSTVRWKALNKLVNGDVKKRILPRKWVWGMTGTPIPTEPTDAWAQCRVIKPDTVPTYFGAFRDTVMRQISQYKWAPKDNALEVVHRAMQPAIRFKREDCIDLPPTTWVERQVELTTEQAKLYKDMLGKFRAEYLGGQITAMNEAIKVNKLVQIALGSAYGTDGDVTIPAKPRVDEVLEIISESGAKVIVFVPLTGALHKLAELVGKEYEVAVVEGATTKRQRDTIFADFQSPHGPRVLIAQPATMAHGLSLTAADTIVWYAPINSNEIYQQANARIVRPGQKRNTLIVKIQGTEIERKMYARLDKRGNTQGVLLDMFD